MGSCVSSSHTNNSSASNSAVKLVALISKPETTSPLNNDVITSTTINSNPTIDSGRQDSDHNNDLDHKDEMVYFDSRGWLDSDCDDDFMSVAGEFTPSRGSTPVHHKFCDQTHQEEEVTSPTDNKKRLLELFKETQDEDKDEEEDYVAEGKARTCLWLRTPVRSSAPTTPNNNNNKEKLKQPHGGCVPRLVSCSSFTDRRRKMMTHTPIDVHR